MKKVILLFIVLISTLTASSQGNFRLKTIDFNYVENGKTVTIDTKLDVYLNLESKTLFIYSSKVQRFTFSIQRIYEDSNFTILECSAKDDQYRNCLLRIYVHSQENILFIDLQYRDFKYFYTCYDPTE